jgi:hypothetical protein
MFIFEGQAILWANLVIQVAGVTSMVIARLTERSWARALCQRCFFFCLLAVGFVTLVAIRSPDGNWLPYGATLGLMAIGATVDLRTERQPAVY